MAIAPGDPSFNRFTPPWLDDGRLYAHPQHLRALQHYTPGDLADKCDCCVSCYGSMCAEPPPSWLGCWSCKKWDADSDDG